MTAGGQVTLPIEAAALLVAEAVDRLWSQWAGDEDAPGCCNLGCCAACYALNLLKESGQLDDLYGWYVDTCSSGVNAAWDYDKRQVGRGWLDEAWTVGTNCSHRDEQ